MDCPHFEHGGCRLAGTLIGTPENPVPHPSACEFCSTRAQPPRQINEVVVSVAINHVGALQPIVKGLLARYGHLLRRKPPPDPGPGCGPGTELKKLLAKIGITAEANCQCNARAAEMDKQGPAWCRAHLDTIVGWLAEEAQRRNLPFLRTGAKILVRCAIRRAEQAARASAEAPG
jgi:hypothetical protein